MIDRGEDQTNWAKANAMTGEELEASILADPDDIHEDLDWTKAIKGLPPRKDHINIRVDHDVLEWFRSNGRGCQTMMNSVLRAFVDSRTASRQNAPSNRLAWPRPENACRSDKEWFQKPTEPQP